MPQYPASSFESAVGGFLQGYSTVRDMRRQNAEDARREREARQREQMRQIQLAESGYQEVDFTLPPDPFKRESMVARIGNKLLGRDTTPERDVRMLKMGPSEAERLAAQNREFQIADREDTQAHAATGWARDDARAAADRAARAAEAEASRRTQLGVAGIYAGASRRADERARTETADRRLNDVAERAVEAAGGDVRRAVEILTSDPSTRDIFTQGMGMGRLQAAASRFAERRRLNDAMVQSRTTEKQEAPRTRRSEGNNTGAVGKPAITQAEAAALRQQGFSDEQILATYTIR